MLKHIERPMRRVRWARIFTLLAAMVMLLAGCVMPDGTVYTLATETSEVSTVTASVQEHGSEVNAGAPGPGDDALAQGIASLRVGNIVEALEYLNQAIELDPTLTEAYYYRAIPAMYGDELEAMVGVDLTDELWAELGNFATARTYLDPLIANEPDNGSLYLIRALMQAPFAWDSWYFSDSAMFEADLAKARELMPDDPLPYELEAMHLLHQDGILERENAYALLNEAVMRGGTLAGDIAFQDFFYRAFSMSEAGMGLRGEHTDHIYYAPDGVLEYRVSLLSMDVWALPTTERALQLITLVDPELVEQIQPYLAGSHGDAEYAMRGFVNYYAAHLLAMAGFFTVNFDTDPVINMLGDIVISEEIPTELKIPDNLTPTETMDAFIATAIFGGLLSRDVEQGYLSQEVADQLSELLPSLLEQLANQLADEFELSPHTIRIALDSIATDAIAPSQGSHALSAVEDWTEYLERIGAIGNKPEWNHDSLDLDAATANLVSRWRRSNALFTIGPSSSTLYYLGANFSALDDLGEAIYQLE